MLQPNRPTHQGFILAAAAVIAGHVTLPAQETSRAQLPVLFAQGEAVNVVATVRDKKGAIVKDLAKEELALSEEGRTP